ncbi:alpha-dextrin endo-1,6-alpha-glucosidase [Paenibacillus sp. FSL R7-0273]|uniref:type I pullulanase n=1 Tax=Paenibacillus sp. FSL R7-0273 TaxID=1536772 RepID=UPI0004F7BCC7|nr:type I pullulanase [Paenibacillus sp. FSL R7-0273]AIQ46043.1 alpha-dextrin endo-1,6-alpha-glucosidase [Paenibacillus sp. FSL R7-0273]OMF92831.1 type I pullulanase [Paenibacillus sp. FSL R7-0273]
MNSNYMNAETVLETYAGNDLGLTYTAACSLFKVWAPTAFTVSLVLYETGGSEAGSPLVFGRDSGRIVPMQRGEGGVWQVEAAGDLKGKFYMYRTIFDNGTINEAADPYATAVSANGVRSAVVDLRDTDPAGWQEDKPLQLLHPADAVIYELHVRDFSAHESSGMEYKGKFKAFTETGLKDAAGNALGIDHLAELGITHVHLLPVFDYQTVDELNGAGTGPRPDYYTEYNWGYDPQHYNVPEGSYSTNPGDPGTRIREFKEMVQALHSKGIAVIMDVVYNHTYAFEKGPFEPLVPDYFYRRDSLGRLSNGSGVGNELATERPMVRKFIKDSLAYWASEYHIDGFRFDLMGLMDSVTIREITEELRLNINPELLIYGEPWTGGDSPLASKTLKGVQRGKGYAVFNDNFRSAIKGDSDGWGRGFVTGEYGKEGAVAAGIKGAIHDFTDSPVETVNYVTAHDNLNLWDKILASQGLRQAANLPELENGRLKPDGDLEAAVQAADPHFAVSPDNILGNETVRRSLLANGLILTSQGIPFIHAGDELLRSKYGDHNSYRSPDAINALRWGQKQSFMPVFQFYKGLIELRRKHPAFRLHGRQEIERSLEFLRCDGGVVAYMLKDHAGGDVWSNIIVVFNANTEKVTQSLPHHAGGWNIVVDHSYAGTEAFRIAGESEVEVEGLSMMVLYDSYGDPAPRSKMIEVHYDRPDGDYRGWNLWVWGTGIQDGQSDFRYMENGQAIARIEVEPGTQSVGYILRLNDWEEKATDGDRFIDCSSGEQLIKVLVQERKRNGSGHAEDPLQRSS